MTKAWLPRIYVVTLETCRGFQRFSVEKTNPENFTKFPEKHLCWRLWHRCFPVNFAKFLRIPC